MFNIGMFETKLPEAERSKLFEAKKFELFESESLEEKMLEQLKA